MNKLLKYLIKTLKMDKINLVIEKLKKDNINPEIEFGKYSKSIVWTDESSSEFNIYEDDISVENNKIAWFQSNHWDNHLLKVYETDTVFNWIPKTYNPVCGCHALLLEWFKEHLIFVYQEKHDIYICSIKNGSINSFNFSGVEIERKGEVFSYETYINTSIDKVRLIKIPELIHLEPIDKKEAEKLDLIPKGINREGNFLGLKIIF